MTREQILKSAVEIVTKDRENQYGAPEDNFGPIAELWASYMRARCCAPGADIDICPEDVGIMMALLKIARIATGQEKPDNYIDLAGYAACAGEIATGGAEDAEAQ